MEESCFHPKTNMFASPNWRGVICCKKRGLNRMNEKINEQVYAVLNKYDKSYCNSGVLANLQSWQNNKGRLVELLRRHSNWNEEALAVIFEVTHSREIDKSTVNYYKSELGNLISNLDVSEDDRNKFIWSLETVACTYSKNLPDADTATLMKQQSGVTCSAGQKTSRIINAICKKYRVDQHPEYNARFARLADSLNPMQVKRTALLSVHPCDYLEMSNRNNSWSSCHCLDGGEYHGGTLSYMNDGCSMIFYTVDDDVTEDFYAAPKRTRQVFCYQNGILLQSRLYPQTDDNEARDMYRNIVQCTIADCLKLPNLWTLKREYDEVLHRVCTHDDALHYHDYEYKYYKPNISLLKGTGVGEAETILVGHTAYCLECSEPVSENNTTYCDSCLKNDYVTCFDCGCRIYEEEAHYIDGHYYCDECCSYCDVCESYTIGETTEVHDSNGYTQYVCSSCLAENYRYCEGCDEYYHENAGYNTQDGFRCNACFHDDYCVCDECGEYVRNDDVKEIDGKYYCGSCAGTIRFEMEESKELTGYPVSA